MNSDSEINEKILETLQELLKWIKIASYKNVKTMLVEVLDSDVKKTIYHLSDGNRSVTDLVKTKIVSAGSTSNYWNDWSKIGIGELLPVIGGKRFKHSFNLEDFGINTKIKNKGSENKN